MFRDLQLKSIYDSDKDDIVNDFYVPALSAARRYDRLAGFFSSSSLYVSARGMAQFISNGGKMRLLAGATLRKQDVDAIMQAKEKPEEIISRRFLEDLDSIRDMILLDHIRMLAWMVANGHLEIKIGLVTDKFDNPIPQEDSERVGIFHQKVGIMEDEYGDLISFSGSVNESATAWKDNIEEFKVFRSWAPTEQDYLNSDKTRFEKYWAGNGERLRVVDVPTAVKSKLIQIAPASLDSLKFAYVKTPRKVVLRDYQTSAITAWFDNGRKGIFEMATGTGKTITAISCLERILKEKERVVTVITCPFVHLAEQWADEVSGFGITPITASGNSAEWKPKVLGRLLDFNNKRVNSVVIITTHTTFSSKNFFEIIGVANGSKMLIGDEMHGLGSDVRQEGLEEGYTYRLGLSATPERWMDDEGTETLYSYFGKVVYKFGLEEAINRGFLTPYEYKPIFVGLTTEELEDYEEKTKKIARKFASASGRKEKEDLLKLFLILRRRIIVNAEEKYATLDSILEKMRERKHCLVYCSPQQIDRVQDMINKKGIIQHKFTAHESKDERMALLDAFAEGQYPVLVAMRCLDEGVDVPQTEFAVLMASSGNPREFIQRRGRVLRRSPGKTKAIIYDIIVVPDTTSVKSLNSDIEKRIVAGEIKRYMEFAHLALNKGEAIAALVPFATKYGVVIGDLDGARPV